MVKSKEQKILESLEKKYTVKKASTVVKDTKISTGVYALDYILSGGISDCVGGHRLEFFGAESSCKTTFALRVIKSYQEQGKVCALIDGEHSFDAEWAEKQGVDNEKLILLDADSLEQTGEMLVDLIPTVDLIIVDSIVSLIPEAEIERDTGEPTMGLQARVNALITRKCYEKLIAQNTTMIFINQLREKIGVRYGNPYTTGGGRALKHFYNTRIQFSPGKPMDVGAGEKKERIGMEINMKAIKNKKGVPFKKAVVDFYFTGEVDNAKCIFFSAVKIGVIQLNGKTYTFGDIKAVGKDKMIEALEGQWKDVEKRIWEMLK